MLVREINSLTTAVHVAWQRIAIEEERTRQTAIKAVAAKYAADSRFVEARDALMTFGLRNADDVLRAWLNGAGMAPFGVPTPKFATAGLRAEYIDEVAKIKRSTPGLNSEESYGIFNVALHTSTMKWTALQPHVYALMADIASATEYDVIRTAIRTFAGGIK